MHHVYYNLYFCNLIFGVIIMLFIYVVILSLVISESVFIFICQVTFCSYILITRSITMLTLKKLRLKQYVRHKGGTIKNPESFESRVEHPTSEKKQNHEHQIHSCHINTSKNKSHLLILKYRSDGKK